jgi:hypothetical protein
LNFESRSFLDKLVETHRDAPSFSAGVLAAVLAQENKNFAKAFRQGGFPNFFINFISEIRDQIG